MKNNEGKPENNRQEAFENEDTQLDPAQKETEKKGGKKANLMVYIAVLFAVAFLLVLLSYLMQLRNSSETIKTLNEKSSSVMQNVETLQEENERLLYEIEENEETIDDLTDSLEDTQEALAEQQAESAQEEQDAQNQMEALDLLWQITSLYSSKKYTACREAIAIMEERDLVQYLSDECINSCQEETPLGIYLRISGALD